MSLNPLTILMSCFDRYLLPTDITPLCTIKGRGCCLRPGLNKMESRIFARKGLTDLVHVKESIT